MVLKTRPYTVVSYNPPLLLVDFQHSLSKYFILRVRQNEKKFDYILITDENNLKLANYIFHISSFIGALMLLTPLVNSAYYTHWCETDCILCLIILEQSMCISSSIVEHILKKDFFKEVGEVVCERYVSFNLVLSPWTLAKILLFTKISLSLLQQK